MNEVFGTNELALILSFTGNADTFNVVLVCKQWFKATRLRHFWNKRIERAKEEIISHRCWLDAHRKLAVKAFDTFNSPVAETLRQQVEWTLRSHATGWINICSTKFNVDPTLYISVLRKTHAKTCIEQLVHPAGTISYRVWFESGEFWFEAAGKFVREATCAWDPAIRLSYNVYDHETERGAIITLKTEHGVYEGQAKLMDRLLQPHGAGKWSFEDGEILEGPDVAFEGVPKFSSKKLKLTT